MNELRTVNISFKLTPAEADRLEEGMEILRESMKSGSRAYRVISNRSDYIKYALETLHTILEFEK